MAVAVVACAEPLAPPTAAFDLVASADKLEASRLPDPVMMQQAIIDGKGVTTLSVTSGTFAYFDQAHMVPVSAVPGPGVLNHVHVKFCKDTYKDYGLHQFSANFDYKPDSRDDQQVHSQGDDNEQDSRDESNDRQHQQVNWDRSHESSILTGTGDASIQFTGIPAGASLEVHYNYTAPNRKQYSITNCTPVLPAPDLTIETVGWPASIQTGVPTVFTSAIGVAAGSSTVPATASCAIYDNGKLLGKSPIINVSSVNGADCNVTVTLSVAGSHTLEVRIQDISPSDFNLTNNSASGTVGVGGGGGSGSGSGPYVPVQIFDPPTVWQSIDTTFDKSGPTPVWTAWNKSQGAKLIMNFPFTSFQGPTSIIVSSVTDGRVIQAATTVSGTGPCFTGTGGDPVAYSVTLCNETLGGVVSDDAILTYQVNATVNSSNNLAGTFVPYGSQITYTITIINGGYKYVIPATALTTSITAVNQTPCGDNIAFSACALSSTSSSSTYRVRSDGGHWLNVISGITGVTYP